MIFTGQRSFLCLAEGLPDRIAEAKNGFERFLLLNLENLLQFLQTFNLSGFFLFEFFTNKARKLKVEGVESS